MQIEVTRRNRDTYALSTQLLVTPELTANFERVFIRNVAEETEQEFLTRVFADFKVMADIELGIQQAMLTEISTSKTFDYENGIISEVD